MPKMKIRPNYRKINTYIRDVERIEKRPPQHEDPIAFFDLLAGKHVEAHLTTGKIVSGILETKEYNKNNVMLRNNEGLYVIRKDILEYIKLSLNREEGGLTDA